MTPVIQSAPKSSTDNYICSRGLLVAVEPSDRWRDRPAGRGEEKRFPLARRGSSDVTRRRKKRSLVRRRAVGGWRRRALVLWWCAFGKRIFHQALCRAARWWWEQVGRAGARGGAATPRHSTPRRWVETLEAMSKRTRYPSRSEAGRPRARPTFPLSYDGIRILLGLGNTPHVACQSHRSLGRRTHRSRL